VYGVMVASHLSTYTDQDINIDEEASVVYQHSGPCGILLVYPRR
jgi:hypothetical protein